MLRACGRRLIAAAGVAALTLIGAGCAGVQTAPAPAFARIVLPGNSAVSILIQGGEVRAAMSDEAAQAAAPVQAGHEFALPVPADQLPAGVTAIKASVLVTQYQSGANAAVVGHITLCRTDDQKAEWKYVSQISVPPGPNWDHAQSIKLPDPADAKASLEATPAEGALYVGLRLTLYGAALTEVRKDGKPVQVQMVVADASGTEMASKVGTLADFGFS